MNTFFLEIWSDMKEKRLWPVAAVLALALLAVPFVLAKPAEEAPAPSLDTTGVTGTPGAAGQVLPAELEAAKPLLQTSTLSEFASKDPFKPLRNLHKVEQAAGVAPSAGDTQGPDTSGTPGGGTDTGSGGGGGGTPQPRQEEKQVFTYQAVVELGTAHGKKNRKVNRLGILPSTKNPLLVFLGVSADDNDEAVFLVDSTVTQAGEGRCRPSASTCSFLYLTTEETRDEHIFTTDDGKEYTIKLLEIRRVLVKDSGSSSPGPEANVGSTKRASFQNPDDDPFKGFGFPLFADEEE
jgi:hypothetical protein